MSDLSIRGAQAAEHIAAIMSGLESRGWVSVDGPPTAYFRYRRPQGEDTTILYGVWTYAGPMPDALDGHFIRRIELIPELFLDSFDFHVNRETELRFVGPTVSPQTHNIAWRCRPEIIWLDRHGAWTLYARLGFIPKMSWFLEDFEP